MQPMLATAGPLPTGPGWAYEFKWDGVRTLVDSGPCGLVLISRLGNEVTVAYPELAGIAGVAEDVLLDGEVVSFVDGRPSFSACRTGCTCGAAPTPADSPPRRTCHADPRCHR